MVLIKEYLVQITPREKLIAATLNQSNKEFLNNELEKSFKPLLEELSKKRAEIAKKIPIDKSQFQVTAEKLWGVGAIKTGLTEKVNTKLKSLRKFYHENKEKIEEDKDEYKNKYKNKIKEVLGVDYNTTDFPDLIENSVTTDNYQKLNGNALNSFTKKALQGEIDSYLQDGFIDKKKVSTDIKNSKFLAAVLEQAQNNGYTSITNCTSTAFHAQQHKPEFYSEKTKSINTKFALSVIPESFCSKRKIRREYE